MKDRMYQFEISRWASKLEMYEQPGGKQKKTFMAIKEEEMLDMIEEMLTEIEHEE